MYAPQVGRPEPEKQQFYDELHYSVENLPATEILIPIGDWNSHGGAPAGVVSDAHAGRGFITCYTEGERFLEFAMPKGLRVGNTWFKKRDTHLAPVPLSIFRSNSKFDENSKHSSVKYTQPITTICCTRHDSVTVVTCANYLCDRSGIFKTRAF